MVVQRLGSRIRKPVFDDPDESKSRGWLWIGGNVVALGVLGALFGYYLANSGTKKVTKKGITYTIAQDLFAQEDLGDIHGVECKCGVPWVQIAQGPPFTKHDMVGEYPEAAHWDWGRTAMECFEEMPLFSQCINTLEAVADGRGRRTSARRKGRKSRSRSGSRKLDTEYECAEVKPGDDTIPVICLRQAGMMYSRWGRKKFRYTQLISEEEFSDDIVEAYASMCNDINEDYNALVVDQMNFREDFGIQTTDQAAMIEKGKDILSYLDDLLDSCEGFKDPAFKESESAALKAAYDTYFDDCQVPSCTYMQSEGTMDAAMKTVALSSPVLAGLMGGVAVIYARLNAGSASANVQPSQGTDEGKQEFSGPISSVVGAGDA